MDQERLKIIECKALPNYKVWIVFNDGSKGEVDLSYLKNKGVFKAWNDVDFFNHVWIDETTGTITWENEIELDSYVLRKKLESDQ